MPKHGATIDRADYDAVIFDMDGVVTDTAGAHASAWKRMFDEYLESQAVASGRPFVAFDPEADYLRYVDGKPRFDGARSFFLSRGIDLPPGEPDDAPGTESVWGMSATKNRYFLDGLAEGGAEAYPSTLSLIGDLRDAGFKTAIITSSKNCDQVLASAGVGDVFDARVDGVVAFDLGLAGKPDPAIFLQAATMLGIEPARAVVVEDAQAGVAAGRAGSFGMVIGVDRIDQSEELARLGADVVVKDLREVSVVGPETGCDRQPIVSLPSALTHFDEIGVRVGSRTPVFFLDYDGTLTPIVERPEDALMPPATREIVERLVQDHVVAMISGRDVSFVKGQVDVDGVLYAGSHGFDIVGPEDLGVGDEKLDEFRAFLPALDAAEARFTADLANTAGANIERKRYSVAVHYRQVANEDVPAVEALVDDVVAHDDSLRKSLGKKVFEVRPDLDWDKGKAVLWLFDALGLDEESALPIYMGDDVTDEDAFAALAGIGVGVAVGTDDRPTAATYSVRDPSEVAEFLGRMAGRPSVVSR